MISKKAVAALGALANEHRLAIFRMLVERGPDGLAAGDIADRLAMAPSSLSFHTHALVRAGLLRQRRLSRQIVYSADFQAMRALVGFLTDKCCQDSVDGVCAPARASAPQALRPGSRRALA
jgi:ArsR family transcriptional regulator